MIATLVEAASVVKEFLGRAPADAIGACIFWPVIPHHHLDGPEDRNGCRNHDEIRLIEQYIENAEFIKDDSGERAGLKANDAFVRLRGFE